MGNVSYNTVLSIPGWLPATDFELIDWALGYQDEHGPPGNLAELGVYMGASAVLIGDHQRAAEQFTVIDLFDQEIDDNANTEENSREYPGLTRSEFEKNYLKVHSTLPTVVQAPSSSIVFHAEHGTHRFVHIDASHLYNNVKNDIESARTLLREDGIVVLDDIRAPHAPGVAAAAWEAVANGMRPIAVTGQKMYATWGETNQIQSALDHWLSTSRFDYETQEVSGRDIYLVHSRSSKLAKWLPEALTPTARRVKATLRL